MSEFFQSEAFQNALDILIHQFPLAIWETVYVTILSTFFAVVIGLPLGVLLVAGEHNRILRIPQWILSVLNVIINLLRSIPFLILMILVFPLTRLIVGTVVGTPATVVPLVIASFPFIARLVESSLRELNPNIIETAQSMGASPMQIVCRVMLPESVPSLISNATIAVTTILGASEPLTAVILSVVLLGTSFTPVESLGAVLIFATVFILAMREGRRRA